MTPALYQDLLDRGWRRSGTLLYKPDQRASCCPQYTIRLDSESFQPSKDQRQTWNRFNKHILGDSYIKEAAKLYPLSREQAKKRNTEFNLVERVHESEKHLLKTPPGPAHALTITLESDNLTAEKYAVFENYQRIVHNEPPSRISKSGFKNFLCSSPLSKSNMIVDGRERKLGSYHQCYRIDGELIAIGVLDLLPTCVSAVYFMYHESAHKFGFGKLGALREIALAKEEGYKWWYAGFYIHNCVKMKYKGDYTPQYMLDPVSYNWDLLDDDLRRKLDKRKFLSLSQMLDEPADTQLEAEVPALESKADVSNGEDSGSDEDPSVLDPDTPLFSRSMPGLLSKDQLLTDVDLGHIKLKIRGQQAETGDLISWDSDDLENPHCLKGIIAELVSAVGPTVTKGMTITF